MPTSTSIQNINTEVDFSSTAQTSLNNSRVRNLANKQSGAISFADCRWGISVPAMQTLTDPFGNPIGTWNKNYAISAETNLQAYYLDTNNPPPGNYSARAGVRIFSSGLLRYFVGTFVDSDSPYDTTWLIVGSNSDYTIRFNTSDTLTVGTPNTDLALTSDREFSVDSTFPGSPVEVTGDLILKKSGTTVITRPCYFKGESSNGL